MGIRYFLYLVLLVMLVNILVYVPNILFLDRYNGSIMSMIIAVPLSTAFAYFFSKAFMKFPRMGLPELFQLTLPKWARITILLYLAVMWYISGYIAVVAFSLLSKQYINPEFSSLLLTLFFMVIICFGALQTSRTVLYITEIIILLNVPLIFFIVVKALTSQYMRWNEVFALRSYVWTWPTWDSLAAATYLFIGYINIVIFNRVFDGKLTTKFHWVIPILGASNLITTFTIPIGFHSLNGVDNYVYPWIATADSMRMEYSFIERVLYLFIILYIGISILFGIMVWHVALELFKSAIETRRPAPWKKYLPIGLVLIFFLPPLITVQYTDQPELFHFARMWLSHRLFAEIGLVGTVWILSRRKKQI